MHDPIAWIETRKQAKWRRLAHMRASSRSTVIAPLREIYASRVAFLFCMVSIALGCLLVWWGFSPPANPGRASGWVFFAHVSIIILGALVCLLPLFMGKEQVCLLQSWAKQYPQVRETCVRWGVHRDTLVLNSIDFQRLMEICSAIAALDAQALVHADAIKDARKSLQEQGIMGEIISLRDRNALDQTVPVPKAKSTLRRL